MSATNDPPAAAPRRYRWPWVLAAAVLLGVILAVVGLRSEVRRLQEQRDTTYPALSR